MFVLSKGRPKTFNPLQQPKTGHARYSMGTDKRGNKKKVPFNKEKQTRNRDNVWKIMSHGKNATKDEIAYYHPAIFPEKLAEDHILSWSNPGDVVLDPFMGSGTTAKMAKLNGRYYVGFEISREYVDIAKERLRAINERKADVK